MQDQSLFSDEDTFYLNEAINSDRFLGPATENLKLIRNILKKQLFGSYYNAVNFRAIIFCKNLTAERY